MNFTCSNYIFCFIITNINTKDKDCGNCKKSCYMDFNIALDGVHDGADYDT